MILILDLLYGWHHLWIRFHLLYFIVSFLQFMWYEFYSLGKCCNHVLVNNIVLHPGLCLAHNRPSINVWWLSNTQINNVCWLNERMNECLCRFSQRKLLRILVRKMQNRRVKVEGRGPIYFYTVQMNCVSFKPQMRENGKSSVQTLTSCGKFCCYYQCFCSINMFILSCVSLRPKSTLSVWTDQCQFLWILWFLIKRADLLVL